MTESKRTKIKGGQMKLIVVVLSIKKKWEYKDSLNKKYIGILIIY